MRMCYVTAVKHFQVPDCTKNVICVSAFKLPCAIWMGVTAICSFLSRQAGTVTWTLSQKFVWEYWGLELLPHWMNKTIHLSVKTQIDNIALVILRSYIIFATTRGTNLGLNIGPIDINGSFIIGWNWTRNLLYLNREITWLPVGMYDLFALTLCRLIYSLSSHL